MPMLYLVSNEAGPEDHLPDIGSKNRGDGLLRGRARIEACSLLVTVGMRVVSRKLSNRTLETDILMINTALFHR